MKTMRALDGDARAMAEVERDRLPVFEAAKRHSAQHAETSSLPVERPTYYRKHRSRRPTDFGLHDAADPDSGERRPVVNKSYDREAYIRADLPAWFDIAENPKADDGPAWSDIRLAGNAAIRDYDHLIRKHASENGVDPDLVRAIMWTEATRYHRFGIDKLGDITGQSSSSLPMNINQRSWASLIGAEPSDLRKPEKNVEAGVELLRRIVERIADPTPEKVGSIWNFSGREEVNDYGAFVQRAYDEKPWLGAELARHPGMMP